MKPSARDKTTPLLILASSSPYRRMLLDRLGIPYRWQSPDIDESAHPDESADALVARLSQTKAEALAAHFPNNLIIGSDQVAWLGESRQILTKPGDLSNAHQQLQACNGRKVTFVTGLHLLDTRHQQGKTHVEHFSVQFRQLPDSSLLHYLKTEQPFDCAGSFKCEGLGIALFERMEGRDPNSLIGLPLIALVDLLQQQGVNVLESAYFNCKED